MNRLGHLRRAYLAIVRAEAAIDAALDAGETVDTLGPRTTRMVSQLAEIVRQRLEQLEPGDTKGNEETPLDFAREAAAALGRFHHCMKGLTVEMGVVPGFERNIGDYMAGMERERRKLALLVEGLERQEKAAAP